MQLALLEGQVLDDAEPVRCVTLRREPADLFLDAGPLLFGRLSFDALGEAIEPGLEFLRLHVSVPRLMMGTLAREPRLGSANGAQDPMRVMSVVVVAMILEMMIAAGLVISL